MSIGTVSVLASPISTLKKVKDSTPSSGAVVFLFQFTSQNNRALMANVSSTNIIV